MADIRRHSIRTLAVLIVSATFMSWLSGCSAGYVLRASVEQAGILLKREPLETVIADPATTPPVKRQLEVVVDARRFAAEQGLTVDKNYSTFVAVDRKVLVWVLTAAPPSSLTPHTWWFPIVGSVPYKGFFERDDAEHEFNKLSRDGLDVALRPSIAYSTLGWFNDPVLSTQLVLDDRGLVDTVIHELFHRTAWVKGEVAFNESAANFIGALGAYHYFRSKFGEGDPQTLDSLDMYQSALRYGARLSDVIRQLEALYDKGCEGSAPNSPECIARIKTGRDAIMSAARDAWLAEQTTHTSGKYAEAFKSANNALLVGERLYYTRLDLFERLYKKEGESLSETILELKRAAEVASSTGSDPYQIVEQHLGTSLPQ